MKSFYHRQKKYRRDLAVTTAINLLRKKFYTQTSYFLDGFFVDIYVFIAQKKLTGHL